MSNNKLSKQELQELNDYQVKTNEIVGGLGFIDLRIHDLREQKKELLEKYSKILKSQNELGQNLQKKYGEGNIDLKSGEITATK